MTDTTAALPALLGEVDALIYGDDPDFVLCNEAGDAYRAGDHTNRIFLTIGHVARLAACCRDLMTANEALRAVCQTAMDAHDAEAIRVNFDRCGCDYCKPLRAALTPPEAT